LAHLGLLAGDGVGFDCSSARVRSDLAKRRSLGHALVSSHVSCRASHTVHRLRLGRTAHRHPGKTRIAYERQKPVTHRSRNESSPRSATCARIVHPSVRPTCTLFLEPNRAPSPSASQTLKGIQEHQTQNMPTCATCAPGLKKIRRSPHSVHPPPSTTHLPQPTSHSPTRC
jgi:hypothetical protein